MKYTVKEFACEIRKIYPKDYDDLTDEKLVELWLRKYPNDISKVNMNEVGQSEVSTKKVRYLKYALIIIILLVAITTKPGFRDHKNTILNEVFIPIIEKTGSEVGIKDLSSISFLGLDMRKGLKEYIDNTNEITFKDYILISTVEYDSQTISYGVLGIVFIMPQFKNEVDKQAKKMLDGAKSFFKSYEDIPSDDTSNSNTNNGQSSK